MARHRPLTDHDGFQEAFPDSLWLQEESATWKKKGLGKVGERGEWCSTTLVEVDLARVGATYEGVGEYECSLSPEVC